MFEPVVIAGQNFERTFVVARGPLAVARLEMEISPFDLAPSLGFGGGPAGFGGSAGAFHRLEGFLEIARLLPGENLIYVGDTARVPYGVKSQETIRRYSQEICDFLVAQGVKAIVVACPNSKK